MPGRYKHAWIVTPAKSYGVAWSVRKENHSLCKSNPAVSFYEPLGGLPRYTTGRLENIPPTQYAVDDRAPHTHTPHLFSVVSPGFVQHTSMWAMNLTGCAAPDPSSYTFTSGNYDTRRIVIHEL